MKHIFDDYGKIISSNEHRYLEDKTQKFIGEMVNFAEKNNIVRHEVSLYISDCLDMPFLVSASKQEMHDLENKE